MVMDIMDDTHNWNFFFSKLRIVSKKQNKKQQNLDIFMWFILNNIAQAISKQILFYK